jgi:hypothetical protein
MSVLWLPSIRGQAAGLVGRLWPVPTEGVPVLASMLLRAPVFFRDSEVRVTGRHHVSGEGALRNELLHRPLGNGVARAARSATHYHRRTHSAVYSKLAWWARLLVTVWSWRGVAACV